MFDFLKSKAKDAAGASTGEAAANIAKEAFSSFAGVASPASPAPAPASDDASPASGKYEVKSGDSLSKIAKKYGVPLDQVIAANPQIKNLDLIHPGETINLG